MNRFNLIVIIGASGTGKSLLAEKYLALHSNARLVDSLKLYEASPAVISAFFSADNAGELAECDTLIIDEIPDSSSQVTVLYDILSYRLGNERNTIILNSNAALGFLCSNLGVMQKIRTDRPLEINLWKNRNQDNHMIDEQSQHLTLSSKSWNMLLQNNLFWMLLQHSNLQCLAMNEDSENMENGFITWPIAAGCITEFIQDANLPKTLKDSLAKVLSWVAPENSEQYQLGINFISSHQPQ